MEYFPHLGLGGTQIAILMALYAFSFFSLLLLSLFIRNRLRNKYLLIVTAALILSVPVCMILQVTIGNTLFSNIHRLKNQHMPKPAECLQYEPEFSRLNAKYKVSPAVLKQWVEKYKLKEEPPQTFKSKMAPNGQKLVAKYDQQQEILVINYNAW